VIPRASMRSSSPPAPLRRSRTPPIGSASPRATCFSWGPFVRGKTWKPRWGPSCGSARAFQGSSSWWWGSARRLVGLASGPGVRPGRWGGQAPRLPGSRRAPALYRGALALLYLSHYEGFGLPVLEAQACGAPVIAARRGGIPEAGGEAAILVDPDRPEEIDPSLARILLDAPFRRTCGKGAEVGGPLHLGDRSPRRRCNIPRCGRGLPFKDGELKCKRIGQEMGTPRIGTVNSEKKNLRNPGIQEPEGKISISLPGFLDS